MRNYSFDVLKLFLALLVVFIHIHVPWREVILPLTRCAVPCFFMISGYFLYNLDMENMKKKLRKGIMRMLYIISLSNMLYIIPWLNHYMKMSDSFQLGWGDVAHFLILGIPLFNPEGVHLWYLQAYLYVLIALYVLLHKSYFNRILSIAVPLLFISHLLWKHMPPFMGSVYHWFSPIIIFFICIIVSMITLSIQNYLNTHRVL